MARALAVNGAHRVYLLGRRLDVLQEATNKHHPTVFVPIQCDVTSKDSLQAAVDRITSEVGYIDLLIANSGIPGPTEGWDRTRSLPLSEIRAKMFDQRVMNGMTDAMNVNVTGVFFTMVAFLELLDAGNKMAVSRQSLLGVFGTKDGDVASIQSQVIVTSSISAYSREPVSAPGYAGSKAAILHLTKQASSNLARFGIRVNALAPGSKWFFYFMRRLSRRCADRDMNANLGCICDGQYSPRSLRRASSATEIPARKGPTTKCSSRPAGSVAIRKWPARCYISLAARAHIATAWC
jgi:NAD(P)-dependent dehydrogenase (short-subunit alcohol dehydrogenase family)